MGLLVEIMADKNIVAERSLLFSAIGDGCRNEFTVKITAPCLVGEGAVGFAFDRGAAYCSIEFCGMDEPSISVHGIDSLHALAQAVDIDHVLKGLGAKYCFYWATGEPYF
jgi:hypothetical protein